MPLPGEQPGTAAGALQQILPWTVSLASIYRRVADGAASARSALNVPEDAAGEHLGILRDAVLQVRGTGRGCQGRVAFPTRVGRWVLQLLSRANPAWHKGAEAVVLELAEFGWTPADLEALPPGVSLPLQEAIQRCRQQPPPNWPVQVGEAFQHALKTAGQPCRAAEDLRTAGTCSVGTGRPGGFSQPPWDRCRDPHKGVGPEGWRLQGDVLHLLL